MTEVDPYLRSQGPHSKGGFGPASKRVQPLDVGREGPLGPWPGLGNQLSS